MQSEAQMYASKLLDLEHHNKSIKTGILGRCYISLSVQNLTLNWEEILQLLEKNAFLISIQKKQ